MFTWFLSGICLFTMGTLFMAGTANMRTTKCNKRQVKQKMTIMKIWKTYPLSIKIIVGVSVFSIFYGLISFFWE